jgi:hypothetical protein
MKNQAMTKFLVLFTFVAMVGANALANILPINGITTGAVSDSYPNLFAPAGYTFAIWGVIYLALAFAVVRLLFQKDPQFEFVSRWFIISNLANTAWIFAWHYRLIAITTLLIIVVLYSVLKIVFRLYAGENRLFGISQRLPYEIYGGWLLVATVANITTLLVDSGFSGFGISEVIWMLLILAVAWLIVSATVVRLRSIAIGGVLLWAYGGIYSKHISSNPGFENAYPSVVFTVVGLMILMMILMFILIGKEKRNKMFK